MNILERFEQNQATLQFPAFRIGDSVKVHLKVLEGEGGEGSKAGKVGKVGKVGTGGKEGKGGKEKGGKGGKDVKERIQIFEGVVIARKGAAVRETFTVRKVSFGVGVERVFPLHSPVITKIEVGRRGRVKRAKLYYLRALQGKASRLVEKTETETVSAPQTPDTTATGPAQAAATGSGGSGARAG